MPRVGTALIVAVAALIAGCGSGSSGQRTSTAAATPTRNVTLKIGAPADGSTVNSKSIQVRGTVDPPDSTVSVDGRTANVTNGVFTSTITLIEGSNTLDVQASHTGYSPASASATVKRSTSKPKPAPAPAPTTTDSGSSTTDTSTDSGSGTYPSDIRHNFLTACENQLHSTTSGCECALSYLESHVSLTDFVAANNAIAQGGTLPQFMYDAVQSCAGQ